MADSNEKERIERHVTEAVADARAEAGTFATTTNLQNTVEDIRVAQRELSDKGFKTFEHDFDNQTKDLQSKGFPKAEQLLAMAQAGPPERGRSPRGNSVQDFKEGTIKNADGSEVTFKKYNDQILPVQVRHVDGSLSTYRWGEDGQLRETELLNKGGVVVHYDSRDGHTFIKRPGGEGTDRLSGFVTFGKDGTQVFLDDFTHFTTRIHPSGNSETVTQQGDAVYKHTLHKDGSYVDELIQSDKQIHPVKIHHLNGIDSYYTWEGGQVTALTDTKPGANGQPVTYRQYVLGPGGVFYLAAGQPGDAPALKGNFEPGKDGLETFVIGDGQQKIIRNLDGSEDLVDRGGKLIRHLIDGRQ